MQPLILNSNNVVELRDLTNNVTGALVTNATVQVTIEDALGNQVLGDTWPLPLNHVANGLYRGTVKPDLQISAGTRYVARLQATTPEDYKHSWVVPLNAHPDVVY